METKIETKTYRVEKKCDCGGDMLFTGIVYLIYPPSYEHQCNICKNFEKYDIKYPYNKSE